MPAISSAEFRAEVPELGLTSEPTDDQISAAISKARQIHDVRRIATIYLAAHILTLMDDATEAQDAGAGVVTDEQIGPRRASYATMSSSGDTIKVWCETTRFGRLFLALAATSPRASIGARVV